MKGAVVLILFAVLFAGPVAAVQEDPDLAVSEAQHVAAVRADSGAAQAEDLYELAWIRERMGKLDSCIATWGYLKKTHGALDPEPDSSAPYGTYGKLADFHIARLRYVQRLAANPPKAPSPDLRRRLHAAESDLAHRLPTGKAGFVATSSPVDMDGDQIPEVFAAVGFRDTPGQPATMILLVYKWNGRAYQSAFRWQSNWVLGGINAPTFTIKDLDGHGMNAVTVHFEPNTDNVGIIRSNGRTIAWAD